MKLNRSSCARYDFDTPVLNDDGTIDLNGFHAVREISHRVNAARNTVEEPETLIKAGELYALGLIDRIYRSILASTRKSGANTRLEALTDSRSAAELQAVLEKQFGSTDESALMDLLAIRFANENPAAAAVRELIDDAPLRSTQGYLPVLDEAGALFTPPAELDEKEKLTNLLRRPYELHPESVAEQLDYIRREWSEIIPNESGLILNALDLIHEESRPYFGGGPGEQHPLVFNDDDSEGFSPDTAWMPLTVMIAKNTLVWLDQLSREYGRRIERLNQIPGAAFDKLAAQGFNALWLIGVWSRSPASKRIKNLLGNTEAEASAYSLIDYRISPELGGEKALEELRIVAGKRGIRLASDMVPNHTGIDADWIYDHPDYYMQTPLSPYPGYSFTGENLAQREGFGTFLEDHYLDQTDAAVVFKHVDYATNRVRYIYHGNDGTHMPWNDTAQLNYLNPEVRERVIETIIAVAKRFPIIRFDAAMTLAREHIRRLWYPQPGQGGAIPSRSEYAMPDERFNSEIPREFWREVVDRVSKEVPGTLLLAEAFWMMEGYFVRTLGMHRVYNSAFMNMLKNEENEKYHQTLQNTLEFDREILKRFVNFMNNPDEDSAIAQFGREDKYFGICTLLVTMPGLPMFGHGQIEGYSEKYGMEYRRAYMEERADEEVVNRHKNFIFPLLKRRHLFAEAEEFTLFDFISPTGINHNVFAYTNRAGDEAALVIYNNSGANAAGTIRISTSYREKTRDNQLRQRTLGEALDIPDNPRLWMIMRQHGTDLEFIRNCRDFVRHGMHASLPGYGCQVYLDFRIQPDDKEGKYRQIAEKLKDAGCFGIEREIRRLHMQPLHAALSQTLRPEVISVFREAMHRQKAPDPDFLSDWEHEYHNFLLSAAKEYAPATAERQAEKAMSSTARGVFELALRDLSDDDEASLAGFLGYMQRGFEMRPEAPAVFAAWCLTDRLGTAFGTGTPEFSRSLIDEWHLTIPLNDLFRDSGLSTAKADYAVSLVKLLTAHREWYSESSTAIPGDSLLVELLHQQEIQHFLLVNRYDDVLWFNKDRFEDMLWWFFCIAAVSLVGEGDQKVPQILEELFGLIHHWLELEEESGFRVIRLMELLAP